MIEPVILKRGGTVADAALAIHKEFAAKLKFARVWGPGKFDGQRVQHDFQLTDGDIIESHISSLPGALGGLPLVLTSRYHTAKLKV